MSDYAVIGDIEARLPYWAITTTSDPAIAEIEKWILEGEAGINAALNAVGLATPYTTAQAVAVVRPWVCDYAEGRTRQAHVASAGDGSNVDGKDLVQKWEDRILWIKKNPAEVSAMLGGGAASASVLQMRSYITDNRDGKTVDNGDFAPRFTKDEVF